MADPEKVTKAKVTAALKALGIERGKDFESLVIAPDVVQLHRTQGDGSTRTTEIPVG